MPERHAADTRMRVVCALFAGSSFPLAAATMIAPEAFWTRFGIGGNPFVESIYGAAIAGEGVMFALGAREPRRYRVFFEYMVAYKTLAVLAGGWAWWTSDARPSGAIAILFGWFVAGLVSAFVVRDGVASTDSTSRS